MKRSCTHSTRFPDRNNVHIKRYHSLFVTEQTLYLHVNTQYGKDGIAEQ